MISDAPKVLWKMCVKTSSERLGILKMDKYKPNLVCLFFDPVLHSFRDSFFPIFYHPISSYMNEFQNVETQPFPREVSSVYQSF